MKGEEMDFYEIVGMCAKAIAIAVAALLIVACFVAVRWMLIASGAIH